MTAPAAPVKDPRWSYVQREPYGLLINGKIVQAKSGKTFDAVSPIDNEVIAKIALADAADVDDAVKAARKAVDEGGWSRSNMADRAAALRRIKKVIEAHADELAFLETIDSGKPIGGVYYSDLGISYEALDYFASHVFELRGASTVMPTNDVILHKFYDPLGVVTEILPWNGPLWTGVQRMAAIIAAGNAAIMKPAQMASLVFARLSQLLLEADLPPGVVQTVSGPGSVVGEALVLHPGVDMVSLTGGIESGVRVLSQAASSVKKVSLELGSKSPNIIFADADFDTAAMWTVMGNFSNAGQICVSGSRALIQRPIYDKMVEEIKRRLESMVVGDPLDPKTQMGSLISQSHADSVWRYIEIGKKEARLITGGERYTDPFRSKGAYIPPTLFAAEPTATIAREEIFGPVLTVMPFDTAEDALKLANNSSYGLSSGVFTTNLDNAWKVSRGLMAGQIYVNQWFGSGLQDPTQGYKQSGYGGVGIEKYMQTKNAYFRLKP